MSKRPGSSAAGSRQVACLCRRICTMSGRQHMEYTHLRCTDPARPVVMKQSSDQQRQSAELLSNTTGIILSAWMQQRGRVGRHTRFGLWSLGLLRWRFAYVRCFGLVVHDFVIHLPQRHAGTALQLHTSTVKTKSHSSEGPVLSDRI